MRVKEGRIEEYSERKRGGKGEGERALINTFQNHTNTPVPCSEEQGRAITHYSTEQQRPEMHPHQWLTGESWKGCIVIIATYFSMLTCIIF